MPYGMTESEWAWRYQNRLQNQVVQNHRLPALPSWAGANLHHHNGQPALMTFTLCVSNDYVAEWITPHARRSTAIMEGI